MPTLNWIGKDAVINHHNDVKFRTLTKKYTFSSISNEQSAMSNSEKTQPIANCKLLTANSDNKIIHGDNLEALKALLPEYEGRIKCIYIDPPYNTGASPDKGGWIYYDNVDSPKLRKWFGQIVGKELDDLSRHDKWLCMMYPRLILLQKLLSDDGAMFISIDDNEQGNLLNICQSIFGVSNVEQYIWCLQDKSESSFVKTAGLTVRKEHEYIIACFKGSVRFKKYEGKREFADNIKDNPDNDPRGPWFSGNISRNGIKTTTGSKYYTITNPAGESFSRNWTLTKEEYEEALKDNRIYFAKNGAGVPRLKIFPQSNSELIQSSLFTDVHTSITGKNELKEIFGESPFPFPKPTTLIVRLMQLITDKDSIILDSFAGSGTTAHAVLNLNQQDGGHRKFILVEMEDYAETITAERVRRVMKGYGEGKNATEGTGGSFTFYELGETVFDENGYLNETIGIQKIREYIWYSETREPIISNEDSISNEKLAISNSGETQPIANCRLLISNSNSYLLGDNDGTSYYFYYEPKEITTLDKAFLNNITHRAEQYVIYADNCLLSDEFMQLNHIVFKKIPRDIRKL